MFGSRRHRPPNPPLTSATADPNAATAAAAVFRHHGSNASLSAAAAATALRNRPMTPTRVAEVQTKRTLRRSASVASTATTATNPDAPARPGLQRRGSSASMTERTFRSPSPNPNRPTSSGSGHSHSHGQSQSRSNPDDMPPVPALPKAANPAVNQAPEPAPAAPRSSQQQQHQLGRAASLRVSSTPLRLASQKLSEEGASSWFGGAKVGDMANMRRNDLANLRMTDPAMASPPSSPPQVHHEPDPAEVLRPSSRASSVNFSYPTRARVGSPPVSPIEAASGVETATPGATQRRPQLVEGQQVTQPRRAKQPPTKQSVATSTAPMASATTNTHTSTQSVPRSYDVLVYDPNSRRMVPQSELAAAQPTLADTTRQSASQKSKKKGGQKAGSHLAAGTIGRAKGAAVVTQLTETPVPVATPARLPTQPSQPPPQARRDDDTEEDDEPAVKAIISSPRLEAQRLGQRAQEPSRHPQPAVAAIPPAPIDATRQTVRRQPSVVREESEPDDSDEEITKQKALPHIQEVAAAAQNGSPKTSYSTNSKPASAVGILVRPPNDEAPERSVISVAPKPVPVTVSHDRTHSNSPARQAHFGPVQSTLTVRHSPPPRSISPRKSAMKHSSPVRGASPSDDTSESSFSILREEGSVSRKRSVRVSFDDANTSTAVATPSQAESPSSNSPQSATRRSWYGSIGRGKRDLASIGDDVVMTPRPALPSFGSVRDKKPRDVAQEEEERPLVRPIGDTVYSSQPVAAPTPTHLTGILKTKEEPRPAVTPTGFSSDHAVGSLLSGTTGGSQSHQPNPYRMAEPLPPIVTSVEGSGYMSDSSTSSDVTQEPEASYETPLLEHLPEAAPLPEVQTAFAPKVANGNAEGSRLGRLESSPVGAAPSQAAPPSPVDVPEISISQPTPPPAEHKRLTPYSLVPGGFPESESDQSAASGARDAPAATSDIRVVDASGGQSATAAQPVVPAVQSAAAESESDSESSIYSDAYEDLSELEGNGFQSLDAIVDSPAQRGVPALPPVPEDLKVATPSKLADPPSAVAQTLITTTQAGVSGTENDAEAWERAKAYWRSLSAEKRAQLEREALEDAGIEGDLEEVVVEPKPKKKKSVERRNSERRALAEMATEQAKAKQPANPERSYQIKPGTKWTDETPAPATGPSIMKKTLRSSEPRPQAATAQLPEVPKLRKSMRANGPTAAPAEAKPADTKIQRPVSSQPAPVVAPAKTRSHRRTATDLGTQSETVPVPVTKRRDSAGSESSFRRSRASGNGSATVSSTGFRKSMRPTSSHSAAPAPISLPEGPSGSSKRFSLRTLSPTGSFGRRSGAESPTASNAESPQMQMRRTLRGSTSGSGGASYGAGGLRMPSFGRSGPGGKKKTKGFGRKKSGSKFSSRFSDSSDDDGSRGGFRSRFEDSSDDEAPVVPIPISLPTTQTATATRGQPPAAASSRLGHHVKAQSSVASTALPEELEESVEEKVNGVGSNAKAAAPPTGQAVDSNLRRSRSGRGSIVASHTAPALGGPMSPPASPDVNRRHSTSGKRHSFLSVLRRKKHDSAGGISKGSITESAARRDTKLERGVGELKGIRSGTPPASKAADVQEEEEEEEEVVTAPSSPKSPRSPRLQKRNSKGASAEPPALSPASIGRLFDEAAGPDTNHHGFGSLKRPRTSGNLGTRTLSGGVGAVVAPRRTVSTGLSSIDGGAGAAGSDAGTVGGGKKKRFGMLRRMFRLDE